MTSPIGYVQEKYEPPAPSTPSRLTIVHGGRTLVVPLVHSPEYLLLGPLVGTLLRNIWELALLGEREKNPSHDAKNVADERSVHNEIAREAWGEIEYRLRTEAHTVSEKGRRP